MKTPRSVEVFVAFYTSTLISNYIRAWSLKMKTKNEITTTPSDDELATRWKEQYPGTVYNLGCFQRSADGVWTDLSATQVRAELLDILIKAKSEGIRPSKDRINSVIEMARLICLFLPQSKENPLQEFVDSCCETGPDYLIALAHLYYIYLEWVVLTDHIYVPEKKFQKGLKALGFTQRYINGHHYWTGLMQKPTHGPEEAM
jgi:hypothetical protein